MRFWVVMGLKTRNSSYIMPWFLSQRKELVNRVTWKHPSHKPILRKILVLKYKWRKYEFHLRKPTQRRNKWKEDHRSEIRNLYSCEKKSLNKRMYWIRRKNGRWQVSNLCSEGYALTPCATKTMAIMLEHCTGIAELRVRILTSLNSFFRLSFRSFITCVFHCDDLQFNPILILLLPN